MSFRFLHAADLHLDTPFQGLGRAAPHIAARLRDASLEALDGLIDTALDEHVDLVVLAGDIYDGAERGLRAQIRLARGVARLDEAGITTVIVHGNHDPVREGWSAIGRWPARCHLLGTDRVQTVTLQARDGTPVAVHGISYDRPDVTENLVRRFPMVNGDAFHIGLLHASVGVPSDHLPYSPCSLADLAGTGHDYWALGHIHRRQVLSTSPHVVYPGNLQGRSFKSSELEPKGAMLIDVDGGQITTRFRALDRVRFATHDVDVSLAAGLDEVIDALEQHGRALQAEHDRGLVVQVRLVGRGGLAEYLARSDTRDEALNELRDRFLDEEPFLWWADLVSHVVPEVDLDALRGGDDLAGTLISVADAMREDPERVRAFLADAVDGEIKRHLSVLDLGALLEEAVSDAISRLRST